MTASQLARVLAISVVLAALSLGGTAHAQESDDPPPQGGVTQPDPDPQPDPGTEQTPDPDPGTEHTPDPETQATPQIQLPSEEPDPSDGIPDSWSEPVGPTRVRVSPQAGGPGTVVTMVADIQGSCDTGISFFQDRRQVGTNESTRTTSGSYDTKANRVVARYTVSSKDAVGWGRFAMSCDMRLDTYRVAYAKFRVLGSDGTAGKNTANRNDGSQLPNRIDTGLGGTADDGGPGRPDPTRLLLPAGLLLIIVGAGLGLRQTARSRR
jgi:hypothetical protein